MLRMRVIGMAFASTMYTTLARNIVSSERNADVSDGTKFFESRSSFWRHITCTPEVNVQFLQYTMGNTQSSASIGCSVHCLFFSFAPENSVLKIKGTKRFHQQATVLYRTLASVSNTSYCKPDITTDMSWSEGQWIALAILPKFSSALSVAGSSWILRKIWLDHKRDGKINCFKQILLGMCVYDVSASLWWFMSTWPMPADTEGVYGAAGTTQSCTAQGFFLQMSLAVPFYNVCLSIYYLLVIKYSVKEDVLRKRWLPWMHGVSFAFPFGTALACLILDQFNAANVWCWVAPYPAGCVETNTCERGENANVYRWAFYFVPLWVSIFVAIVAMALLFFSVWEIDNRSLKYRKPQVLYEQATAQPPISNMQPTTASSSDNNTGNATEASNVVVDSEDPAARADRGGAHASRTCVIKKAKAAGGKLWEDHERSRDVFYQALCYLGAFLLTFLFATINRAIQAAGGQTYFALLVLHVFFVPLQGFLNFMVYRRPKYMSERKRSPDRGRIGAAFQALHWSSSQFTTAGPSSRRGKTTTTSTMGNTSSQNEPS